MHPLELHILLIYLLGAAPIYLFGTEEQKEKYLTPLCTGESLGAFGLTEPEAGSDAGGTRTTATSMGIFMLLMGINVLLQMQVMQNS